MTNCRICNLIILYCNKNKLQNYFIQFQFFFLRGQYDKLSSNIKKYKSGQIWLTRPWKFWPWKVDRVGARHLVGDAETWWMGLSSPARQWRTWTLATAHCGANDTMAGPNWLRKPNQIGVAGAGHCNPVQSSGGTCISSSLHLSLSPHLPGITLASVLQMLMSCYCCSPPLPLTSLRNQRGWK